MQHYIKAQRLSWFSLVHRMTKDRMVKEMMSLETDIYKISRETKNCMGKRYKSRFKNYENK
jgi:hypothetical protein